MLLYIKHTLDLAETMKTLKRISIASIIIISYILFTVSACGNKKNDTKKITIAAAANMRYAIKEITNEFTQLTGIECELIISSSGKLTAQIIEGAPYDVFVSADMKYPYEIYANGLAQAPPKIYAFGNLVLWTMVEGINASLHSLTNELVQHIALANPKTAPYGKSAMDVLEHYKLLDKVEHKLVYGESISQTNQFIVSKSAEMGFTSMSVVLSTEMKGMGQWIALDSNIYAPIEQGIVIIKRQKGNNNDSDEFYDFIFSNNAKKILVNFGYSVDE